MKDIADLIGRVFLCFIFFFEIYDSIVFKGTTMQALREAGFDNGTNWYYFLGLIVLILGSITVLIGYRSTFGAFLLLCYWVPVTIITHDFWNIQEITAWREVGSQFMKNMAIIGALLLVMAHGSGKYSVRRLLATTKVGGF